MENPGLVIFDIDGTLLPGTSCERLFFKHLADKKILGFKQFCGFAIRVIALSGMGKLYIIKANKGYLRGFSKDRMSEIGKSFFQSDIIPIISKDGISRLIEHKDKGDTVVLLSGMPEFLLSNFADFLEVPEYYGSVMEINKGYFTGKTTGIFPLSKGKAEIAEGILKMHNRGWSDLTAYADHYGDRFLLSKAGVPVAVNPNSKLKSLAEKNNWRIEFFK